MWVCVCSGLPSLGGLGHRPHTLTLTGSRERVRLGVHPLGLQTRVSSGLTFVWGNPRSSFPGATGAEHLVLRTLSRSLLSCRVPRMTGFASYWDERGPFSAPQVRGLERSRPEPTREHSLRVLSVVAALPASCPDRQHLTPRDSTAPCPSCEPSCGASLLSAWPWPVAGPRKGRQVRGHGG